MTCMCTATGKWLISKHSGSGCHNLQVYNYSGPQLSQYACRIPTAEGLRGSQNEEWLYKDNQFCSVVSEECCGSVSRPIPKAGLCLTRGDTNALATDIGLGGPSTIVNHIPAVAPHSRLKGDDLLKTNMLITALLKAKPEQQRLMTPSSAFNYDPAVLAKHWFQGGWKAAHLWEPQQ